MGENTTLIVNQDYVRKPIGNCDDLFDYVRKLQDEDKHVQWAFRAQDVTKLSSTLERACLRQGYDIADDAPRIETEMIRQFRRLYDGEDRELVLRDTVYCLSLMRHYFAPARLVDFTYSWYIAVYFGLECAAKASRSGRKKFYVWCIDTGWCATGAEERNGVLKCRRNDRCRTDKTFLLGYLGNVTDMVCTENPIPLHRRLHLQQGLFLCPGNVRKSFEENLRANYGSDAQAARGHLRMVACTLDNNGLHEALERCRRMNLSGEALFPGLQGFAGSMTFQLEHYLQLAERRGDFRGRSF